MLFKFIMFQVTVITQLMNQPRYFLAVEGNGCLKRNKNTHIVEDNGCFEKNNILHTCTIMNKALKRKNMT